MDFDKVATASAHAHTTTHHHHHHHTTHHHHHHHHEMKDRKEEGGGGGATTVALGMTGLAGVAFVAGGGAGEESGR